ncbi:MAG: hypothetical protein GC162_00455 [Planctomycetes bacterium]|nr:hypothetical protein [Planctomycetota bacterium]
MGDQQPTKHEPRDLDVVQQWFEYVITHPMGPDEAILGDPAQRLIRMNRGEMESVIGRSKNLTAERRITIYANAYYARLLECLGESFPVLKRTVGEEAFNDFAFDYLQHYPSRSYTLNKLGDHFADFLHESRCEAEGTPESESAEPGFADLLIDLTRLEWTIEQVFDGPGIEHLRTLTAHDLAVISRERFAACRLVPAACLRLMRFSYPVNAYYTAVRRAVQEEHVGVPAEPGVEFAAITRQDYIVRRFVLTAPQYRLLTCLCDGQTVGHALEAAGEIYPGDDEQFATDLHRWFDQWTAAQFFLRIQTAS